jgi:ssRNA-specific RNase YbeY (16S rRNA maturation enzyme)
MQGYDHERAADARRMERRERAILERLGFPDPYAPA